MANIPLLATPVTLKAAGAETVSTTGATVQVTPAPTLGPGFWLCTVAITAISGTPTLLLVIEASNRNGGSFDEVARIGADGVLTWGLGTQPAPFTSAVTVQAPVAAMAPVLRYRSIIGGGTPSLTYSVTLQFFTDPSHA